MFVVWNLGMVSIQMKSFVHYQHAQVPGSFFDRQCNVDVVEEVPAPLLQCSIAFSAVLCDLLAAWVYINVVCTLVFSHSYRTIY